MRLGPILSSTNFAISDNMINKFVRCPMAKGVKRFIPVWLPEMQKN
jgi:hypothetical protein